MIPTVPWLTKREVEPSFSSLRIVVWRNKGREVLTQIPRKSSRSLKPRERPPALVFEAWIFGDRVLRYETILRNALLVLPNETAKQDASERLVRATVLSALGH